MQDIGSKSVIPLSMKHLEIQKINKSKYAVLKAFNFTYHYVS